VAVHPLRRVAAQRAEGGRRPWFGENGDPIRLGQNLLNQQVLRKARQKKMRQRDPQIGNERSPYMGTMTTPFPSSRPPAPKTVMSPNGTPYRRAKGTPLRRRVSTGGRTANLRRCYEAGSVPAEAARRVDSLEFRKIEIADDLQRLGNGTVLQAAWQPFQPSPVLGLECDQLSDRVLPTLGTAAVITWPTRAHNRRASGTSSAVDLMSVSGPGESGQEVRPGLCPGSAKCGALGTSLSVFATSAGAPFRQ
jgi:hypothetical protein